MNSHKKSNSGNVNASVNNDDWFRAMIENSPILVMRTREDATITYANDAVCKLFSKTAKEIIGHKWLTGLSLSTKTQILDGLEKAKKDLIPFKIIIPYTLKNGNEITIEWITSPIFDNQGKFIDEFQGTGFDITDRIHSENELQRKEDQLEIFFRQSLDGFFFMQVDEPIKWSGAIDKEKAINKLMSSLRVTKVNRAFLEQYGVQESNVLGFTPNDFSFHGPESKREVYKLILENENITVTTDERKTDGSQIWIEGNYYLIRDNENRITGLFGIQRDVTNSKNLNDRLQKSEESYRGLFNSISDAIYIQDQNGVFIDVNLGVEKMYNYKREVIIGKTPEFLSAPGKNDLDKIKLYIERTFNENTPYTFEFWGLRKDGKVFPKEVTINKGIYFGQDVIVATAREISEHKLTEQLIKESEERFRNIYENSPIGIYRTTIDGKIILANPVLIKMLGYSSFEEMSKLDLQKGEFSPTYSRDEYIQKFKHENQIAGFESTWKRKDGTEIFIRENARAVVDEKGEILYFEGTVEDITEKYRAEEALIKSEEKLRETNLMKDKFFSIIAHDLRSPFQGLLGIASILSEEDDLTLDERIEYEAKLFEGLKTQFNLLEELLTWSRVQRGVIEFHPAHNNLSADVLEVLYPLKSNIEKKQLAVEINIPSNLIVLYDKNMIATVIRNLISNAIKFTNAGGNISITAFEKGNDVVLSVTDSGIGISKEDIPKLFRIDTQFIRRGTFDEGGTGLGLILCNEFVEKHYGKIWIESEVGKGSTFYFSLPKERD